VVFSSIAPGFAGIITHELGHKMGGLADEYECYVCDGSDDDRTYGGAAPSAVNLTTETVRTQIPWSTLILPSTPLPTTVDSPAGVTGLWEGGGYFAHGIFRPQRTCHMRESGPGFCSVCNAHMSRELRWHCTACELDPDGFACLYGDLLKRWQFLYEEPVRIRWPIPPCLSCPFDAGLGLDTVLVILGMPDTADLKIFDDAGEFVTSTDGPVKRIAQVSFVARADRQYFAELSSGPNDQPTGAMVELSVQLFRGDVEQELPEGP
jgi:hypothetical protein